MMLLLALVLLYFQIFFDVSAFKVFFTVLSCKPDPRNFFCIPTPAARAVAVKPISNNTIFCEWI